MGDIVQECEFKLQTCGYIKIDTWYSVELGTPENGLNFTSLTKAMNMNVFNYQLKLPFGKILYVT